jgi:small subunit ribosomal protein S9
MPPEGKYTYGVGRRKTASAQVRLYETGEGAVIVNDRPMEKYFTRHRDREAVIGPLEAVGMGQYTVTAVVSGGGVTGQAGAVMQGLARALVEANPDLRSALRRGGFLTRDPRMKERKKPGLKRARKAPQYTKR